MEYEFEVLPNIILKDLSEIKLTKYVSKVTEKDINKVIEKLKLWASKGNTIVAQGTAVSSLVEHKIIKE